MDLLQKILETKKVAQDKDIKDREGTQPSKYFSGVSKKSKEARDRHFKKGAKMDDDNPAAYKPAPGDAGAKTKPSQHTKKFKQMFGENYDGDMAQNSLENIVRNANNLKRVVKEDGDYPAWWNSKLTKADDYLDVCHDYLMSELSQSEQIDEELEEGKLVAPAHQVIKTIAKEVQKKMQDMYSRRPGDGVSLINQFARMVGMTVSDKKQQKGTLFLKMGDELAEAKLDKKAIKQKLSKIKGLTKDQLTTLSAMSPSTLQIIINQLSTLAMGEEIEERFADRQREKTKSQQKAHQKAMMKIARKSIKDYDKRNKKEDVEEERDYKKEYANYHSKPEQVKRRQKRNEARRSLKNFKDIKGKDVHHKDNNPMNNDKSNLSIVSQNYNRKEPRLREVLDKNASQQDYIDDFRKSDAPQFKGKSDKKIRDMAIAAYLSKNESTKEYGKSLRKIALDRQLKNISKKDKATLLKIADLLAKEK
jgi:hypothetical protein